MGEYDGFEFEMYNENVMELCGKCLRVRITLFNWIQPTNDFLHIFMSAKKHKIRTLCHKCLEEILALKCQKEEIYKAGKLIIKLCKCGKAYHRQEKIWFQLSKMQTENLNSMIKEGKVEILRAICPKCEGVKK